MDAAKAVVQLFKKSSHALTKLHEMQRSLKMEQLKLKQDVVTRWNSTYDMLDRLLRNKDPVISTLAILNSELSIESRKWKEMELAVRILKPFYDATVEISSEQNVTLSKTAVLARIILEAVHLHSETPNLPESIRKLCEQLTGGLQKRFALLEQNVLVAQSIFLDPRFKKQGFGNENNFIATYNGVISKVIYFVIWNCLFNKCNLAFRNISFRFDDCRINIR